MADIRLDPKVTIDAHVFDASEITALSHLYRGELYRSTVWRTRLDTTTNWAVVTTGISLSLTFSSASATPLPLVLVGLLVAVFLSIEARRYRFFDFWRIRAHVLEVNFFGPILRGPITTGTKSSIRITAILISTSRIWKRSAGGSGGTMAGSS
jgi:uncharacterized membrane protein